VIGLAVLRVGLMQMPIGSILEGYVAPAMEHHEFYDLEVTLAWHSVLAGTSTLLGPLLVGFCRSRATGSSRARSSSGWAWPRPAG
jgi:hypothetical protein